MITKPANRLVIGILCSVALAVHLVGCAASPHTSGIDKLSSARLVFFARHTERELEGEDPPLTRAGEARAQALAAALRDTGVTAIITTQWKRTRDTAKPLATLLKITPEVVPVYEGKAAENSSAVANAVRRHKEEVVLVIGHITVTGVIAALGGPRLPTICDNVFSDLFMFAPSAGDRGLLHLHYGAVEDISPQCRLTAPLRDRAE
jgi:phosphohistidine phosphatase SixA